MDEIIWSHERRKLSSLKPHPNNPRRIPKDKFQKLVENIEKNGYTNRIIINHDNVVLGGNQRLRALKQLGFAEIDVLVPDRELTQEEQDRINITDNLAAGEWDFDALGNSWDTEKLIEWGMPVEWLLGDKPEAESEPADDKPKKQKTCPSCGELL